MQQQHVIWLLNEGGQREAGVPLDESGIFGIQIGPRGEDGEPIGDEDVFFVQLKMSYADNTLKIDLPGHSARLVEAASAAKASV